MRAQYEYGRGLMVFIPPTEAETATLLIEVVIARLEEAGLDAQEFYEILDSIAEDRRVRQ
jgi:hypothetical protein